MKKTFTITTISLITSLLLHGYITGNPQPQQVMLKSCIVSNELEKIPPFKIYFEGIQTISNEDGFFTFPLEQGKLDSYSLLICKDIKQNFDAINTIKNLTVNQQKPYMFFSIKKATMPKLEKNMLLLQQETKEVEQDINSLTTKLRLLERQVNKQQHFIRRKKKPYTKKTLLILNKHKTMLESLAQEKTTLENIFNSINQEHSTLKQKHQEFKIADSRENIDDFWIIKEKDLMRKSFEIPQNCIITCLNPKIVDHVENWKFSLNKNFVTFPRIILKNNLETKNIKHTQSITRSSLKSELYSLETKIFHEPKTEEYKHIPDKPNLKVSLVR